jgi:hypothetical protein
VYWKRNWCRFPNLDNQTKDKIMKKFVLPLIALAALSTASFAGNNRNYDIRDSDTYFGKYATRSNTTDVNTTNANTNTFVVPNPDRPLTNFERMKLNQENNESSSHSSR